MYKSYLKDSQGLIDELTPENTPTPIPPDLVREWENRLTNASPDLDPIPDAEPSPDESPSSHPSHSHAAAAKDMTIIKRGRLRFHRYAAERESRQLLVDRAAHLLPEDRTLLEAHLRWGMSLPELAILRKTTLRALRRRINALRAALMDPAFLLAIRFRDQLPPHLRPVARDYFLRGIPVRQVAALHHKTVHQVRKESEIARSILLLSLAQHQQVPPNLAAQTLRGGIK